MTGKPQGKDRSCVAPDQEEAYWALDGNVESEKMSMLVYDKTSRGGVKSGFLPSGFRYPTTSLIVKYFISYI